MLVILVAADSEGLLRELRFFSPLALNASAISPPVPQYNPGVPAVNAAIQRAAAKLPESAICVIDRDAWTDDFERAAFLLLPRTLWPYSMQSTGQPATSVELATAMLRRHARCLLASPSATIPGGLRRVTRGAYSLYVATKSSSQ